MRRFLGIQQGTNDRGVILIASMIAVAAIVAVAAVTIRRSTFTTSMTALEKTHDIDDATMKSIVNLAILKVKDYSWGTGHKLSDLMGTNPRFKTWADGAGTYNGVSYTVAVADNYESAEGGSQVYNQDRDSKGYLLITANLKGRTRQVRVLMSPGGLPAPHGATPAEIPGAIGVCYGYLNLATIVTMRTGSLLSGYDKVAPGISSCPANPTAADLAEGGACDSYNDQYGIASTSWFGVWDLGTIFDIGGLQGVVEGIPQPNGSSSPSAGFPTRQECAAYDAVHTSADNLLAAGSPDVVLHQKNLGTKYVNGNLTIGTVADPKVLYIKTGWFGEVQFNGTVNGAGIIIASGNVTFRKAVKWTGMVIDDSNALGNLMKFDNSAQIYGGVMINRPLFSAEIGAGSLDIRFSSNNTTVYFSQAGLDTVLSDLDPNYTPPLGNPGQSVGIYSMQYL